VEGAGTEERTRMCALRVTGWETDEDNEIEKGIIDKGDADCAMGVIGSRGE
jgi:hypothetical protein